MKITKFLTNIFGSTKREVTAISGKAKEEIQRVYFTDEPVVRALKVFSNSSKCQNTEACRVLANMSSNPVDLDSLREAIVKARTIISKKGVSACPGLWESKLLKSKLDTVAISSSTHGLTFPVHTGCRIGVNPKAKTVIILPDGTEKIFDDITVKLSGKPYTGVVKYFDKTSQQWSKEDPPLPSYFVFNKGKFVEMLWSYSNGSCKHMV